jgi:beta-glucosidase
VIRKLGVTALGLAALWLLACASFSLASGHERFSAEDLARPLPAWPPGFLWGTATAAHQVEGGNRNDWSRFEEQEGRIARGERSGQAVDHWNRMGEDVALMQDLRANAYRFSIEWSRLEPHEGQWDDAAFARYLVLLGILREARITPMVTLLHFSLPQWLADRGGVRAADFPLRFALFASEAARRLGPEVDLWCTINEPNVQMYLGYVEGVWPPGHKKPAEAAEAFAGLLRAHALGAQAVRRHDPGARVGVAQNLILFEPASKLSVPDWLAARGAAEAFDWAFYDSIQAGRIRLRSPGFPTLDEPLPELLGSVDYFGANYYRRDLIRFAPTAPGALQILPGPGPRNDLGWEIHPEGLLRLLRQAFARYRLPIYVTENGIADARGDARPAYLRAHAYALTRAITEGIPVKGYFHWTLMDNFEWALGFAPRFGLYRVEPNRLTRVPTPAAGAFAELSPLAKP